MDEKEIRQEIRLLDKEIIDKSTESEPLGHKSNISKTPSATGKNESGVKKLSDQEIRNFYQMKNKNEPI
ncbi:MAG TPA: hypothetical protein PKD83_00530 [Ignavibacteria bacterium]|nr:hypothetical protein [Ignavibacteria bacterium]